MPLTKADRIAAVSAAAAHDLNEELTIVLGCAEQLLSRTPAENPNRGTILIMRAAAQRCAWKAKDLLQFSASKGARPNSATFDQLIREQQ